MDYRKKNHRKIETKPERDKLSLVEIDKTGFVYRIRESSNLQLCTGVYEGMHTRCYGLRVVYNTLHPSSRDDQTFVHTITTSRVKMVTILHISSPHVQQM